MSSGQRLPKTTRKEIVHHTQLKELKHLLQTWRILATESLEAKNEQAQTIY